MNKLTICKTLSFALVAALFGITSSVHGQGLGSRFEVTDSNDSVEIIAGSSRRLTFEYNVPELMVENPEIIKATPVAPNEVLISGLRPGVSTITVSDANKQLQTVTIHVTVDVRKLQRALKTHFPNSRLEVHALQTGVILKGNVAKQSQLENVVAVARDYFPTNVINQGQVDGSQLVAIKVKVYEVSRTKLRKLGVDWSIIGKDAGIVSSVAELIQEFSLADGSVTGSGQNVTFGVVSGSTAFNAFIEALEQNNVAKLLDQPVLVAQHGRPAEFLSGGEIPIAVASGLGTTSIEFRPFGTKLDIVPLVHGQGELTLEVRAEVSEVANDLSNATGVPGFRVRRVNTGVRMLAGHTLALAGDYREETETEVKGIPKLMDGPILGPWFRATQDQSTEQELVFMITPRFINEVDNSQLPRLGPGQLTTNPSDRELYGDGYTEVPRCVDDCPVNDRFEDSLPRQQLMPESVPQSQYNGGVNNEFDFAAANEKKESKKFWQTSSEKGQSTGGFSWPQQNK